MKNARQAPQVVIRMSADLKRWLEEQAAANHRSLNGQAVFALEQYRKLQEDRLETSA